MGVESQRTPLVRIFSREITTLRCEVIGGTRVCTMEGEGRGEGRSRAGGERGVLDRGVVGGGGARVFKWVCGGGGGNGGGLGPHGWAGCRVGDGEG
jgi:hypothetical protein